MDSYDVLGVSRFASDKDIRNAYKHRILETHPDKGGKSDAFMTVQKAYDRINDEGESLERFLDREDPLTARFAPTAVDGFKMRNEYEESGHRIIEEVHFKSDNTVHRTIIQSILVT
jgi:curved DNA-binding protein CbpA